MKTIAQSLDGKGLKIAIAASRFNEKITEKLLQGTLEGLKNHGCLDSDITLTWVPGAFELPLAAKAFAATKTYHAIICLGCVIKGATPHFDFVAGQSAAGITQVSLDYKLPVIFGVITTNTLDQALERAGVNGPNRGLDAALAAIEMGNVLKAIG